MTSPLQSSHRNLLASLLLQQDFSIMPESIILEVARLLYILNESVEVSRLAFDRLFQHKLLRRCLKFGEKGATINNAFQYIFI